MIPDPGFSTGTSLEIFSAESRITRMLDVETALAAAQASLGMISRDSAAAIAAAAAEVDGSGVLDEGWERGTPVLPLVERLRALVPEAHRPAVHFGTTTQDIVDTALMLQVRDGLQALEESWRRLGEELAAVASAHRDTPMLGRTFLQAGGVITFGRKVAGWLGSVTGDLVDLAVTRSSLPIQLGGPLGSLHEMGELGPAVGDELATLLGLAAPSGPWHTDRRPIRSTAAAVGTVAATAGKIATDTMLLGQTGVEEVSVRPGASSSIDGKCNPIDAIRANAASRFTAVQAAGLSTGGPHEHERGAGAWHAEWVLVPLLFHGASAAAEAIERSVGSMRIDTGRMAANLASAGLDPSAVGQSAPLVDRMIAEFRATP